MNTVLCMPWIVTYKYFLDSFDQKSAKFSWYSPFKISKTARQLLGLYNVKLIFMVYGLDNKK